MFLCLQSAKSQIEPKLGKNLLWYFYSTNACLKLSTKKARKYRKSVGKASVLQTEWKQVSSDRLSRIYIPVGGTLQYRLPDSNLDVCGIACKHCQIDSKSENMFCSELSKLVGLLCKHFEESEKQQVIYRLTHKTMHVNYKRTYILR